MSILKDFSPASISAGFIAALVGYTASVAIVFQAALAFKATPAQLTSWMWALGIGMGVCCLLPSLKWRMPVVVAWSTPGAAVLAVSGSGFDMAQATGAFLVCAVLIILSGVTGLFERLMNRIPLALAAGLLAGVLGRFGMQAFGAAQSALLLVIVMLLTYLATKRWLPRYAVLITLVVGIVIAASQGQIDMSKVSWALATPLLVAPTFSWAAIVGLAVPLFVVTMASQNLPGVSAIRASGYDIPISKVITFTGIVTLILAPFGAFALNLAAITAALCMGPQAHEDRNKRYTASVALGIIYIALGLFGGAVAGLLIAFPSQLITAIAGLALLGTIAGALHTAMQDESSREAALIAFLVTLSGVTIAGIGSAFWGVVAGALALAISRFRATRTS